MPDSVRRLHELGDERVAVRASAARELCSDGRSPPLEEVPEMIDAIRRELYVEPFAELLRCLGASGTQEARPLVQQHLFSRHAALRAAARDGLRRWFVRNGVLREEDELPAPPHPIYGVLVLHPAAPAARSLERQIGYAAPAITTPPEPRLEVFSRPLRTTGIVTAVSGYAALFVGLFGLVAGESAHDARLRDETRSWAAPLAVGGIVVGTAGVCMIYLGARTVPVDPSPGAPEPRRSAVHGVAVAGKF